MARNISSDRSKPKKRIEEETEELKGVGEHNGREGSEVNKIGGTSDSSSKPTCGCSPRLKSIFDQIP